MEQFCNLWRLGQGFVKSEAQKTNDLLQQILIDIKTNNENGSSSCSVVSGRFWRSIYELMSTSSDSCKAFMCPCIELLFEASKNPHTRNFLVNSMHFVPLIGELALKTDAISTKQGSMSLFGLLERLTTNYTQATDELVFPRLIKHLVHIVQSNPDRFLAALALSILLNICRNNRSAAQHLLHQIHLSEFLATANEFKLLGARLDLIISRHTFRQDTLTSKKANIFALIDAALIEVLSSLNVQSMGQLCSFLGDVRESVAENQLTISDDSQISQQSVEQIVIHLETAASTTTPISVDTLQQLLQLTDALLLVSNKSFSGVLNRLLNATIRFVEEKPNQYVSALALDTIRNIIDHEPSVASVYCDKLLEMVNVVGAITSIDLLRKKHSMFLSLFRLLDTFVSEVPTTSMHVIPSDAFDAMWSLLLDQTLSPFDLASDELRMYVYAVHLLVRCSEKDPTNVERINRVVSLLSATPVHFLLARAINSGDFELQRLVFDLAKSKNFSADSVCKISTRLHRPTSTTLSATSNDQSQSVTTCCTLKEPTNARLDLLMQHIQSNVASGAPTSTSYILELYSHKMRDCDLREKSLQQQLGQAQHSLTALSQDLAMQSLEFERYNSFVYQSASQQEQLTIKCDELRREAAVHHTSLQQMNSKFETKITKFTRDRRDYEQRLTISAAEIENYKQQIETGQRKAEADVKRYKRELKELQDKKDVLVQSVEKNEKQIEEYAQEKLRWTAEMATKEATIKKMEEIVAQKQSEVEAEKEVKATIMNLLGLKK